MWGSARPALAWLGGLPCLHLELASQAPGEDSTSTATNKRAWGAAARQCCRWAASRGSASPRSREAAAPCRRLERVEGKACQRDPSLEHEGCCRPAAPLAAPGASRRIHSTNQSPHPIPQERGAPQPFPHSPSLTQPSPRNRSVRPEPACLARSSLGVWGCACPAGQGAGGKGSLGAPRSQRAAGGHGQRHGRPPRAARGLGRRTELMAAGAWAGWARGWRGELGLRSKSWCTSEWNPSSLLSALLRRPRVCGSEQQQQQRWTGPPPYKSGAPLR